MKVLKKSALSLAVAGVVYGTAMTPVYAAAITQTLVKNDTTNNSTVVITNATNAITSDTDIKLEDGSDLVVTAGNTLTSDGSNTAVVSINVDESTGAEFELNVTVNGNLNGTDNGTNDTPANAVGLLISEATDGDS